MAWIAPSTRADGFVVTAAVWNQDVVANGIANRDQVRAAVSGGYVSRSGANLVYAPNQSNVVFCFEGGVWVLKVIPDAGVAVGATGLTASTLYYMYVYDAGGGAMTLDLITTGTVNQNGIPVKSGATNRTFLAWCYANASGSVTTYIEDAATHLICNRYNRRHLSVSVTATGNWSYATATWRGANGAATMRLHVVCDGISSLRADLMAWATPTAATVAYMGAGIGIDSTTAPTPGTESYGCGVTSNSPGGYQRAHSVYEGVPSAGYHYLQWLEYGTANVQTQGLVLALGASNVSSRLSAHGLF